jgi:hypothetical protein
MNLKIGKGAIIDSCLVGVQFLASIAWRRVNACRAIWQHGAGTAGFPDYHGQ